MQTGDDPFYAGERPLIVGYRSRQLPEKFVEPRCRRPQTGV